MARQRPTENDEYTPRRTIDLRVIALAGFFVGLFLHACAFMAVVDDGSDTTASSQEPIIEQVATATVGPSLATPTPSVLPDRTDCEEIRGTEYRSASEREFFLQSCN